MIPKDCLLLSTLVAVVVYPAAGSGASQAGQDTFLAAVYEHRVINQRDPAEVVTWAEAHSWQRRNLRVYKEQAKIAATKGAQIIVFPENGILGYDKTRESIKPYVETIPDPKDELLNSSIIPCKDATHASTLKALSCIARENSIYVVANMAEKLPCDNKADAACPQDGQYHFDTNVVFDLKGELLAKYRKKYLYWQPMFDSPREPEVVTIRTPFGILGTFVAGEIFYKSPAVDLIEQHNVDTVVMTATWDNTFPYPHAIAVQEGFAVRMRVNLLAANTHQPKYEIGGSGVYTESGAVSYHYSPGSEQGHLVIGELPVKPRAHAPPLLPPWTEDNMEVRGKTFKATISGNSVKCIPLKHLEGSARLCDKNFCCSLSYSFKRKNEMELYAFGVFNGIHSELITMYVQTCGIFKCAGSKHKSCGKPSLSSWSIMGEFRLSGSFFSDAHVFPYVTTHNANGTGLSSREFMFQDNVLHSADGLSHPLSSAILFGRVYSMDSSHTEGPAYETVPTTPKNKSSAVVVTAYTSAVVFAFMMTFKLIPK